MSAGRLRCPQAGLFLAGFILFTGCGGEPERNRPTAPPMDQPKPNYLEVLERVKHQRETTENLESITQALEQFQLRMGRTPASLNELVEFEFLPAIPAPPEGMDYAYDRRSGTVRLIRAGINYLDP